MHLALPSHAMYFSAIIFEFDFTKMPETFTGGQLQSFTILKKNQKICSIQHSVNVCINVDDLKVPRENI